MSRLLLAWFLFAALVVPLRAEEKGDFPVALVNVPRVFKECTAFNESLADFNEKLEAAREQMKAKKAEIDMIQALIKTTDITEEAALKQLQETYARLSVEYTTGVTKLKEVFLRDEAKLYAQTFEEIQVEIKRICKDRGILLVMRTNIGDPETNDRNEILQRVNRSIVYQDGLDITDEIVSALNKPKKTETDEKKDAPQGENK